MVRTVVYTPNYENLALAKSVVDRTSALEVRHSSDVNELEAAMRQHDCHALMIFLPRRLAELGEALVRLAPYIMRWHIAISVVGNAPTIEQAKRMKNAAISDYAILPMGSDQLAERLDRAVQLKRAEAISRFVVEANSSWKPAMARSVSMPSALVAATA